MGSEAAPAIMASVGSQNTSDLMRNGVEHSDLSSYGHAQSIGTRELHSKKMASQGKDLRDSFESSDIPLAAALT